MSSQPHSPKKSRRPAPKAVKNVAGKLWIGIRILWKSPLVITIILLILAGVLLNLLVTQAFQNVFTCDHLVTRSLNTDVFCAGYTFTLDLGFIGKWDIPILPALNVLDPSLQVLRKFIAWNIILFFALVSLVLAFIASKAVGFVKFVMTEQGRKVVLTNLSIWLLFFVLFCALFYFNVVVKGNASP